jgi:hypothetical protein
VKLIKGCQELELKPGGGGGGGGGGDDDDDDELHIRI